MNQFKFVKMSRSTASNAALRFKKYQDGTVKGVGREEQVIVHFQQGRLCYCKP